jgi:hypothetical protein
VGWPLNGGEGYGLCIDLVFSEDQIEGEQGWKLEVGASGCGLGGFLLLLSFPFQSTRR